MHIYDHVMLMTSVAYAHSWGAQYFLILHDWYHMQESHMHIHEVPSIFRFYMIDIICRWKGWLEIIIGLYRRRIRVCWRRKRVNRRRGSTSWTPKRMGTSRNFLSSLLFQSIWIRTHICKSNHSFKSILVRKNILADH